MGTVSNRMGTVSNHMGTVSTLMGTVSTHMGTVSTHIGTVSTLTIDRLESVYWWSSFTMFDARPRASVSDCSNVSARLTRSGSEWNSAH